MEYGVDPYTAKHAVLDAAAFGNDHKQKQSFLQEIIPTLGRLVGWLKTSGSMAIIADREGYILESMGDPVFLHDAEKIHLNKGACWAEQVRGTNAIGTAIAERQPLEVIGRDHFLEDNHILFCSASPIFSPHGEIIAVFDVSGYRERYHPSLLGMVDTIARKIEDWILLQRSEKQLILSLYPESEQTNRALLAIDADGVITGANREARSLLGIGEALTRGVLPLTDLLEGIQPLLQRTGQRTEQDARTVCHKNDPHARWIASVIIDTRPTLFATSHPARPKGTRSNGGHVATYTFAHIYGCDTRLQAALDLAKRAAQTDYTILVAGESGTGKEMVSQAIHRASRRADQPFVAINCGAITKTLLESELFGYEPGAFTGAKQTGHPGKIELANGGTLFLDEIAEMPPDMQVSLLRVLQEFTVTRVGGVKPIPVDVRIIAATHKDLWQEVQEGRFRADLFFRLQGIHITLPPLREREDRLQLASQLLQSIDAELGKAGLSLAPEAMRLIEQYPWPGNVRELAAALRHAAFLTTTEMIDACHFPGYILSNRRQPLPPAAPAPADTLERLERATILETLEKTRGNVAQAARLLGISRNTLYRKLRNQG